MFDQNGRLAATAPFKSPERIEKKDNIEPLYIYIYVYMPQYITHIDIYIYIHTPLNITPMITKAGRLRLGSRRSEASKGGSADERPGCMGHRLDAHRHGAEFG